MEYKDIEQVNASIKTTDVKGRPYAEVNERIKAFRQLYPQGFIRTRIRSRENGVCVMTAEVGYYDTNAKGEIEEITLGTGTAYEKENSTFINKTSYIENCETSCVGRALGMLAIGIDASVASAEEVQNAIANQEPKKTTKAKTQPKAEEDKPQSTMTAAQKKTINDLYAQGTEYANRLTEWKKKNNVHGTSDMSSSMAEECIKYMKGEK